MFDLSTDRCRGRSIRFRQHIGAASMRCCSRMLALARLRPLLRRARQFRRSVAMPLVTLVRFCRKHSISIIRAAKPSLD
jgi:hypothetical protein